MTDAPTSELLEALTAATGIDLEQTNQACIDAAGDFGRLAQGRALAVVRPHTPEDVVALVRFAREHKIALTPRGTGLSQSGQSIAWQSLSVSMRGLTSIDTPDLRSNTIWADAGATWRELLAVTEPLERVPPVQPFNLDLSLGGVLSAGGFGSTSHRDGPAVEHVQSLEIVTGAGDHILCSNEESGDLFRAALGGLGRFGLITRVCLRLRAIRPQVRTFFLHYRDIDRFLADQARLIRSGRADHMEGFCSATMQGFRKTPRGRREPFALWSYGLHVSVEHEPAQPPTAESVLADLQHDRVVHIEEDDTRSFNTRYDVRFDAMRMLGGWTQLHPWLECMLPVSAAERLLPVILDRLPMVLGDGHRATWVGAGRTSTSLMLPAEPAIAFALLPMGVAERLREPVLQVLAEVERTLLENGGKRYLSGWLFQPDEAGWRRHFGETYESWKQHKVRFDPQHVIRSYLFQD